MVRINLKDMIDVFTPNHIHKAKVCDVCKESGSVFVVTFYPFTKDVKYMCKDCYEGIGRKP